MKIKGSLSAAQKFTPDIFPKPSKLWTQEEMVLADPFDSGSIYVSFKGFESWIIKMQCLRTSP